MTGTLVEEEIKTQISSRISIPHWGTVKQAIEIFTCFTESGLRYLIFSNQDFNEKVVKRIGAKVILDIQAMDRWLSEQNGK